MERRFDFKIVEQVEEIEMTIGKIDGVRRRKSKKENVTLTCRKLNGKQLLATNTTVAINN